MKAKYLSLFNVFLTTFLFLAFVKNMGNCSESTMINYADAMATESNRYAVKNSSISDSQGKFICNPVKLSLKTEMTTPNSVTRSNEFYQPLQEISAFRLKVFDISVGIQIRPEIEVMFA